jgi:hypothetical protein
MLETEIDALQEEKKKLIEGISFFLPWLRSIRSLGRIGKLECDFILRDNEMRYSYVQVAYTIALSKDTEDREYKPLESIKDNYPKYVATVDSLLQKRNGIEHINLVDFMRKGKNF